MNIISPIIIFVSAVATIKSDNSTEANSSTQLNEKLTHIMERLEDPEFESRVYKTKHDVVEYFVKVVRTILGAGCEDLAPLLGKHF